MLPLGLFLAANFQTQPLWLSYGVSDPPNILLYIYFMLQLDGVDCIICL